MHCNYCFLTKSDVMCPKCVRLDRPKKVGCFCSKECFARGYKEHMKLHENPIPAEDLADWDTAIKARIILRINGGNAFNKEKLDAVIAPYPNLRKAMETIHAGKNWEDNMTYMNYAHVFIAAEDFPEILEALDTDAGNNLGIFSQNMLDFLLILHPGKPLFTR